MAGESERPRALLVSTERPWPLDSGVRRRLSATLAGLAQVADVDLCSVLPEPGPPPPAGLPAAHVLRPPRRAGYDLTRLPRWLGGHLPRSVALVDWEPARAALRAAPRYDVAWVLGAHTLAGIGRLPADRVVLDVDDVPYLVLEHKLAARAGSPLQRAADRLDARRWRSLLPRLLADVDAAAVCSSLDQRRLGGGQVVIPNGYDPPAVRPRRSDVRPVLVCVGGSDYGPNDDANVVAAREVLPLVRRELPDAELWLVGTAAPGSATSGLGELPGVRLLGHVPDVPAVLAEAAVSLVAIRFGGGTRVKVLEAFAHELPVVSTSVGVEGLEVRPGEHVLVADDAAGLAAACLRVLRDAAVGTALSGAARRLLAEEYTAEQARSRVAELARAQLPG